MASSSPQSPHGLRFGIFEMDLDAHELRKDGLKVKLQDQPFRVLATIVAHAGEIVSREELYSLLSSHSTYDYKHALNNAIQKIREVLNDSSDNPKFVETVQGRGYRFLSNVELIPKADANRHFGTWHTEDPFVQELAQIRLELLGTDSLRKLRELVHRANG